MWLVARACCCCCTEEVCPALDRGAGEHSSPRLVGADMGRWPPGPVEEVVGVMGLKVLALIVPPTPFPCGWGVWLLLEGRPRSLEAEVWAEEVATCLEFAGCCLREALCVLLE